MTNSSKSEQEARLAAKQALLEASVFNDGSPRTRRAIRRACELVGDTSDHVELMHLGDWNPLNAPSDAPPDAKIRTARRSNRGSGLVPRRSGGFG